MRFACLTVVILCLLSATAAADIQFNLTTISSSLDILGGPSGLIAAEDFFGGSGTDEPKDIDIKDGTVTFVPVTPFGNALPGGFEGGMAAMLGGDADVNTLLNGSNFSATSNSADDFSVFLFDLVPNELYLAQIFGYAVNSPNAGVVTIVPGFESHTFDTFTDLPENGGTEFARVLYISWIAEDTDALINFSGASGIAGLIAHNISPEDRPAPPEPCTECTWQNATASTWNAVDNWSSDEPFPSETRVPNLNTQTAVFASAISAPRTVFTDTDVTVKGIQFDNANRYVIGGAGNVNLEADSGNANISVVQGSHQFQAVVNLASDTDLFTASGTTLVFDNALNLQGRTLTKTGDGTMEFNNRVSAGGGTIDCQSGSCIGSGTVGGDLNNSGGTVAPGNSPGVLTIDGNYTQGGLATLALEIGGTVPGDEHDQLVVTGTASLDGTVDVSLINGFTLSGDLEFLVLDAADGGISGDFSSMSVPGGMFTGIDAANGDYYLCFGSVTCGDVGPILPDGDFNSSKIVDSADLNLVLFSWNQLGATLPAEWNYQRPDDAVAVGVNELNLVLFNWNAMASSTAAVPEPAAWILSSLGLLWVLWFRRARNA